MGDFIMKSKHSFLNKKNISIFSACTVAFVCLFFFQNCSDMSAKQNAIILQSLYDSQKTLDQTSLPTLLNSENLSIWYKNPNYSTNKASIFSDKGSILFVANRSSTGTIVSFGSAENAEEMRISINNNQIQFYHITDSNNYSLKTIPLPNTDDRILVAASFGTSPNDFVILINGMVASAPVTKQGTPLDFGYLYKTWLNSSQSSASEVVIYNTALNSADLNVLSRYIATNSQVTNVRFDPTVIGGVGNIPISGNTPSSSSPQFLAAKSVIDSSCLSCHNNSNVGDFRNLTQNQYIQKGLIIPKDPTNSKMYYRLNGALSGPGPKTMPQGGSLTPAQVQAVADWINSI